MYPFVVADVILDDFLLSPAQITEILGEEYTSANTILSLVIGISYHYTNEILFKRMTTCKRIQSKS